MKQTAISQLVWFFRPNRKIRPFCGDLVEKLIAFNIEIELFSRTKYRYGYDTIRYGFLSDLQISGNASVQLGHADNGLQKTKTKFCIYIFSPGHLIGRLGHLAKSRFLILSITPTVIDKNTQNFNPDKITCFYMLH